MSDSSSLGRPYPRPGCLQRDSYLLGSRLVFNRTPIASAHLAWGTVSNSLSKKVEVNTCSLAWVNSSKSRGLDFYYRLVPYQLWTSHLSITWLTCYPSDWVFNYEWHVCTKERYICEVQLVIFSLFFDNLTDAVVQGKDDGWNGQMSIRERCLANLAIKERKKW